MFFSDLRGFGKKCKREYGERAINCRERFDQASQAEAKEKPDSPIHQKAGLQIGSFSKYWGTVSAHHILLGDKTTLLGDIQVVPQYLYTDISFRYMIFAADQIHSTLDRIGTSDANQGTGWISGGFCGLTITRG
ncbi:hypothetical protein [uncultured Roseobacter sp.]|uniref:hypothetical protein n=1 Tax=uncultured Roseobacter sp. TaxID=114847 RepID=UPI00261D9288|nr:hypothetical protein [uncultured Roseobacter sp.]